MIQLTELQLVACTECTHHFVQEPKRSHLACSKCGGLMVDAPVYADHRDIAGLPLVYAAAQLALEVA